MNLETQIKKVTGRAVPVAGDDIDTDRIMPARYLKCVTFESLGQYAFQDERFDTAGKMKPHPFNEPAFQGASVLIVNKNFGCGSSREHAPQGLHRWGIKAIIAESFAEIFAGNCTAIGLPTLTASESDVKKLMEAARKDPQVSFEVDLDKKQVSAGSLQLPAEMKESSRRVFLEGTWDSSAVLLAGLPQARETAQKIPYLHWPRA